MYTCQRCSQLPPPPPIFSLGPPPNLLAIDIRCSSRLLSSSSSMQQKKLTSSSLLAVSLALGVVIVLLISTGTLFLIKNRMIKRREKRGDRQRKYDDSLSSVKFNGHNHHQNWTTFMPLLSESCSSDQTLSTPPSEYPCAVIDPLLTNDIHHEYEQIKYDNASHYYCLVYCRQCASYHQTSSSLCPPIDPIRPCYQHQCTCQFQAENNFLELQPMFSRTENNLNHPPPF